MVGVARPGRRARCAARSREPRRRQVGRFTGGVVRRAGGDGLRLQPLRPSDELTVLEPQPAAPPPGAAVVLPVNVWVNGELEDQLDLETYEYVTLAQLFAREVTAPAPRQYVSPDGSLVLPAGRVFRQPGVDSYAGMDETGWRWSHILDAYGLMAAPPGRRVVVVSGAENRTYRATVQANGRSAICSRLPSAAARAWSPTAPGTSTSPTARSSSTTRPAGRPAGSTCPNGRFSSLFGGAGPPHAVHPYPSRAV